MSSIEAWNVFYKTGNIIDYLLYKKIKNYENNKK